MLIRFYEERVQAEDLYGQFGDVWRLLLAALVFLGRPPVKVV